MLFLFVFRELADLVVSFAMLAASLQSHDLVSTFIFDRFDGLMFKVSKPLENVCTTTESLQ